jgi:subtilisin-like proprotein convertase family protein
MRATSMGLLLLMAVVAACGPGSRPGGSGGNGDGVDGGGSGSNHTTVDADNNCGTVTHPEGSAVPLPDGVCGDNGDGNCTCTTDADCAALTPAGQHCWDIGTGDMECRESYTSTVTFTSFGSGQKITQPSDIVSVSVNMSHEWLRDLEIDLMAPSGEKVALDLFGGQTCSSDPNAVCEVFVGNPINTDGDCPECTTEMGMAYTWTPTATTPAVLPYSNAGGNMSMWNGHDVLPTGNYSASDPWTNLVGATLNGVWTFSVTDLWPIDAGMLHSWTISFNPAIVQNCSTPPIQ